MSDSFWKKEISFGRKPKQEQPTELEVAPAVRAILEPEHAAVEQPAVGATAPAEDAAPAVSAPTAAPAELPTPKGDYGWLTTSFDPNDLPDEMPAIVAPPVSGPPPIRVPLAETASSSPVDLDPVAVPIAATANLETSAPGG